MLDRGSHKSAEELAHEQERFDIHVMAFADHSAHVRAALQEAFSIDAAAAQRLLAETPVVVKRGATPEVADALYDVLAELGAQVVILPAPPSAEADAGAAREHRQPAPVEQEEHAALEQAPAAGVKGGWGGLDVQPLRRPAARSLIDSLTAGEHDPFAAKQEPLTQPKPQPQRQPQPQAVSLPPDPEAEPGDGDLEFDIGGRSIPAGVSARPQAGDELLIRANMPPLDTLLSARPAASNDAPPPLPDLGLGSVPPLPELPAILRSMPPPLPAGLSSAPPPAPRAAQRGPQRAAPAPPPRAAPRAAPRPGPLPALPALPSPPPMRASRASLAAPAPAARAAGPSPIKSVRPEAATRLRGSRMLESAAGLPRIDLASPAERKQSTPRADATKRTAIDNTQSRLKLGEVAPSIYDSPVPAKPKPVVQVSIAPRRARGTALVELVGGVVVLVVALHMNSTILHGSANWVSVVLHGVALYAVGAGVYGLRP